MLVFFPTQDMVDFYTKFLEIVLWGQDNTADEVEEEDGDLRTYARAGQLYYVFAKRKHEKEVKITANGGKSARGEKSRRIIQHAKKEGCGVGRPPLSPVMY